MTASRGRFAAVVVAGGRGTRFGGETPKQLLDLCGVPVWRRSVDLFLGRPDVRRTVLVRPAGEAFGDEVEGLVCVTGGESRAASVAAGLTAAGEADFLAVHDAARPLATSAEIDAVFAAAVEHGAALPGRAVAGTLRRAVRGLATETVDRRSLFEMQTPQVARNQWMHDAVFHAATNAGLTDEGEGLMRAGYSVRVVETGPMNFKITTPADLELARLVVAGRAS